MDSGSTEIPIIDLAGMRESAQVRQALAAELSDVSHNIGFFVVINHGIEADLVNSLFAQTNQFFELPEEQKRLIDKARSPHFRGWEPVGTESTNGRPDIREQIDLWSEHSAQRHGVTPEYLRLLGPNQWMPETLMPGFRNNVARWFDQLGALSDDLLAVMSHGLGLPESHFETLFGEQRMSLTKLICYPETPAGQFGVNAHHDTGFLTLVATGTAAGLQVEAPNGSWIDVPCVPNGFVVNLGEMLQAMTGQYFLATPHRVFTTRPRISMAYFHGPSLHTRLDPIQLPPEFQAKVAASPRHMNGGYMARREETERGIGDMESQHRPQAYGEQLWNYFARSYPENVARHYPD